MVSFCVDLGLGGCGSAGLGWAGLGWAGLAEAVGQTAGLRAQGSSLNRVLLKGVVLGTRGLGLKQTVLTGARLT